MAISVVQRGTATTTGFTGTVSKAYGSSNTLHNKLIAVVIDGDSNGTGINTPTDTAGNTWVAVSGASNFSSGSFYAYKTFVVDDCLAGANTVTATNSSFNTILIYIYEVAGLAASSSFDKRAEATGDSSSTPSSGSATVTNNNELLLGFVINNSSATTTYTLGTGYSNLQSSTHINGLNTAIEEQIISGGGSQSAGFTLASNNGTSTTVMLTFSDTAIAGGAHTQSLTGGLSFAGAMPKQTSIPIAAGLSFAGTIKRAISRSLTAAGLSFAGTLTGGHLRFLTLTGRLSFGSSVWFAGTHSVNVSNNTGWDFVH